MATEGEKASGDYSIITRDDGKKQVAYKGKPLYYWIKDTKPGEKSGAGVNNVWQVATP
jgi:predicted lipoprotein with Yx(FWY)xxD motif